jgi:hypothetical protein
MGCFKGKCCITGYPISEGDEVVGIYTFRAEQVVSVLSKPTLLVGIPIRGHYNDYGGMVQTPELSTYESQLHGILKAKGMVRINGHDGRATNSWVVPCLKDNAYLMHQLTELLMKRVSEYSPEQQRVVHLEAYAKASACLTRLDEILAELPEGVVLAEGYAHFVSEAKRIFEGLDGDLVELSIPLTVITGHGSWALMHAVAYDELVAEARTVAGERYERLLPEMWTRLEKAEAKVPRIVALPSEFSGFKNLSRMAGEIEGPVVGWYLGCLTSKQIRERHSDKEIVDYALFGSAAAVMDIDATIRGTGAQEVDTALRKKVMSKVGSLFKGKKNTNLLKNHLNQQD